MRRGTSRLRYTPIDQASRNELGHFDTLEDALQARARFVTAAPEAAEDLEIWDEDEDARVELDPEIVWPAQAA